MPIHVVTSNYGRQTMSADPRTVAPDQTTTSGCSGLRRRLVEQAQAEILAARAAGEWERAESLTLRAVNYPQWVREQAMAHAAAVAAVPLDQRAGR